MQTITLPYPPSTNELYANVAGRGRIKSARYRTWRYAAGWELLSQRPDKITGAYELSIALNRARSGDLDNRVKAVSDLLVELRITPDDKQMEALSVRWFDGPEDCRVTIRPVFGGAG